MAIAQSLWQDDRLSDAALPVGVAWAVAARQAAQDRLSRLGLPQKRDEYWRYTDPSALMATGEPDASPVGAEAAPFADLDCLKLVFVDGRFDAAQSDAMTTTGLEIDLLADALLTESHWIKDLYGVLETAGQSPVPRALAALNTAMATDGVVIRVTQPVDRPVHMILQQSDHASASMLHSVIRIEPGATLTLLETGTAAARMSQVIEVDVADGGRFHHIRMPGAGSHARAVTHCFARLAAGSEFRAFTLALGGLLTRSECVVTLSGAGAKAHVAAAVVGEGASFHHDDTVFVTHDAVGCESRQVFKKVLRGGATGVFQGKILVRPGAQKTDGYQISQALLLDDDSRFLAKPELEIYADDVVCSHGSTVGAIDDTALFYLRSRGVSEAAATDLLVLSFLAAALDEIAEPGLAEQLRDRLEGWLARRHG